VLSVRSGAATPSRMRSQKDETRAIPAAQRCGRAGYEDVLFLSADEISRRGYQLFELSNSVSL
jgi:hypothetical protein